MNNPVSHTSRWIVSLPANCESGKLLFLESTFEILGPIVGAPNCVLVENIVVGHHGLQEAFYASWEKINLFTVACSLIGFGQSQVKAHVSTYLTNYDTIECFDVAVPFVIQRETNSQPISQTQLRSVEKALSEKHADAVICIASALRAHSVEEKVTLMHSGGQEMAKSNTSETIKQKCAHCGRETDTGRLATNNYLRDLFKSCCVEDEQPYVSFSKLRNKIGHGKPISSLRQFLDARFTVAKVQGTLTYHLDSLIDLTRSVGQQAVVGIPFTVYMFKKEGNGFSISPKSYESSVAVSKVMGKSDVTYDGYTFDFGIRSDVANMFTHEYLALMFSSPSSAK